MGTLAAPSAADIRAALQAVLASRGFAPAERLTRLLRYVVEETLEGREGTLKETVIGVEVFGKQPGYDPRIDGAVRTEASKLRARLKEYYDGDGARDPVRIDLPKSGYVPVFIEQVRGPVSERTLPGRWIVLAILIFTAVMVSIAAVMLFGHPRSKGAPPPSIAVLPFVDGSVDHSQEYLCDGMTEQILDTLGQVQGFQVVSRSSVFALKGEQQDVRDIGQRLNVRSVLEGSVQRDGSRVRVTAQLINAADGFQLWSQTYDRDRKDIFALEDDIPRAIVDTLQIKLTAPLPQAPRADLEAFDLYLRGRYSYYKWQPADVRHSTGFFDLAVENDPRYALAYAGLADSYAWLGFFRDRPADVMPKARAAAQKAIELDPRLDSAYISLAEVDALYDYDWDAAQRDYARAFAVNPSSPMFAHALTYLAPLGRIKEAIAGMNRAHDLDPLNPLTNTGLGALYLFDRQYDAAIAQFRNAIALDPRFEEAHALLFYAYTSARRASDARAELARLKPAEADSMKLDEVQISMLEGNKAEALKTLREWTRAPHRDYFSPVKLACAYAAVGDKSAALDQLERAYRGHDGMLAFLKVWPQLDSLRAEPRFVALLAKMRLP